MPPDFVVIGHIVKDVRPGGWRLGGSVAYAALQAQRLGRSAAAVTACAPDLSPAEHLPAVQWHVLPSHNTTGFENIYVGGRRQQRVLDLAEPIGSSQVPTSWCRSPIVLLAPVLTELDPDMGGLFPPATLVGLGAQGWLRRLQGGRVVPGPFQLDDAWLTGDVVFLSEEDVETPERAGEWLKYVRVVVLTRGGRGCTVWTDAGREDLPAFSVREVDPTGAGDVFAAAFLVNLAESGDVIGAARFGSAAASLVVQARGLESVPGREQIESVLQTAGAR